MKLFASLSFRLALFYAALFSASVAALLGFYFWFNIRIPMDSVKATVANEAAALAGRYIVDGEDALVLDLDRRAAEAAPRRAFHAFLAADGRVVTANLPSWPEAKASRWLRIEADLYLDGDEEDHDALVLDRQFDDGARLLVGRDIEDLDEREEAIFISSPWLIGSVVLLGILGAALMSRVIGRRIEAISTAARQVIAGDLSGRVETQGTGDDFDRLGETLNVMLARIEELVGSVRRVSDNVAHELRTPLARLQADLRDLQGAGDDRRAELVESAVAEVERLNVIFDAVLRIARIEGRRFAAFGKTDISALLEDVTDLYMPAAEAREISLSASIAPGLYAMADRDLVFQAVSNLLDNAIKYSPSRGAVRVEGRLSGDEIEIIVSDEGPGVPPDQRERVFERFYRLPETEGVRGEGLGLSLVAAVASLHTSEVLLEDAGPGPRRGLRVRWKLPHA